LRDIPRIRGGGFQALLETPDEGERLSTASRFRQVEGSTELEALLAGIDFEILGDQLRRFQVLAARPGGIPASAEEVGQITVPAMILGLQAQGQTEVLFRLGEPSG